MPEQAKAGTLAELLPDSLSEVRSRIPRLLQTYKIFFREIVGVFRWKLLSPLLYGAAGIGLQVAAIGVIFQYVRHLAKNDAWVILGYSIQTRESLPFLTFVSAACLALLVGSAYLTYLYNSRAVAMSTELERHCMQSLIGSIGKASTLRIPKIEDTEEASIVKMAMNDTRACGRSFLLSYTAIVPLVTFFMGASTLLYLNWQVTGLLAVSLACFFGALYRVNLFGVENNRKMEKFGSKVRKNFRDTVWFLREGSAPWEAARRQGPSSQDQDLDSYLAAYGGLFGLSYRSSLVGDLFLALTLTAVLFGLSTTSILGHEHHWSLVSAYLVGLQYAIRYLKQTINSATLCNRFFPQVFRFFSIRNLAEEPPRFAESRDHAVVACPSSVPFPGARVRIDRGKPAWIYYPKGISRFNASEVLDSLLSSSDPSQKLPKKYGAVVLGAGLSDPTVLREYLQSSTLARRIAEEIEARKGSLFEFSLRLSGERIAEFCEAFSAKRDGEWTLDRARKACFTLALFRASTEPFSWVFAQASEFRALEEKERVFLLSLWRDRFVLLFSRDIDLPPADSTLLPPDAPAVVFGQNKEILWVGPTGEREKAHAALASQIRRESGSGDLPQLPDDEDLDLADL